MADLSVEKEGGDINQLNFLIHEFKSPQEGATQGGPAHLTWRGDIFGYLPPVQVFVCELHSCSIVLTIFFVKGFPGGSVVENLPANAVDMGSVPGLGGSPRE